MPLFDHRIGVFDLAGQDKNTGVALKAKAGVDAQMGPIDVKGAAVVVAHEKDRPAAFVGNVFRGAAAAHLESEGVAVVLNGSSATTPGSSGTGRMGTISDGLVVAHDTVEHGKRDPNAVQGSAVGAKFPRSSRPPNVDPTT